MTLQNISFITDLAPQTSGVVLLPGQDNIPALTGIVDLYPVEEHEVGAEITSYPVESGASLVDNVVIKPKRLKLRGQVANLLTAPGNAATPGRAADAWQAIVHLMEQRDRLTVSTLLGDYTDMVITRVKAPIDVRTGRALQFEMELQEVLVGRVLASYFTPEVVGGAATDRTAAVDGGQRSPQVLPQAPTPTPQPVAPRGIVTPMPQPVDEPFLSTPGGNGYYADLGDGAEVWIDNNVAPVN